MATHLGDVNFFSSRPILSLQSMLRTLSFVHDITRVVPTGMFDENTKKAVMDFQKLFNLEVTGEVDHATFMRLAEEYNNLINDRQPLSIRIFDEDFEKINENGTDKYLFIFQYMMKVLHNTFDNLPDVDLSGINDNKTMEAVKYYQELLNLEQTGLLTKEVANYINELFNTFVE